MSKPLTGAKIAILVSNGFTEHDVTLTQRALLAVGADVRIISTNQGLVNGWSGASWGHHFAVDCPLNEALGADYSMLVIPGGRRSLDKLKLTAHTNRFFGSFMQSDKPVAVIGDALQLAVFCDQIRGRTVTGPENIRDLVVQAGGVWEDDAMLHIDTNLMTGVCDRENAEDFVNHMVEFFISHATMNQAA